MLSHSHSRMNQKTASQVWTSKHFKQSWKRYLDDERVNATHVYPLNYARAETTELMRTFTTVMGDGENRMNQFFHLESTDLGFPFPMANKDTVYSAAVIDTHTGPVQISLPKTDRYMSVQCLNQDHYVGQGLANNGTGPGYCKMMPGRCRTGQMGTWWVKNSVAKLCCRVLFTRSNNFLFEKRNVTLSIYILSYPNGRYKWRFLGDWAAATSRQCIGTRLCYFW